MTNKKTTRRALWMSVMSLILCFAMLVGTTFAWFTDSVSSGMNQINSGNLDVELYYKNETTTSWTAVDANTNVFKQDTLWEPGHTEVVYLKLVNAGTLALKYQLGINVASETAGTNVADQSFNLSDHIEFGVIDENGETTYATREEARNKVNSGAPLASGYTKDGSLYAANGVATTTPSEAYVTLVVYMPDTVGNEANYKKGTTPPQINLGINLYATQVENESDTFGPDYDGTAVNADVVVTTNEELLAAIQDTTVTVIAIDGDLTYDWGGQSYENSQALLLKGKTLTGYNGNDSITFAGYGSANPLTDVTLTNITVKDATEGDDETSWEHGHLEFEGVTAKNVTFANSIMLDGNSVITNCEFDNQVKEWYALWVEGGNATITNTTFTGTRAIKIHEAYGNEVASVTVDNCTFELSEKPGVVIGDLNADTTVTIKNSTFANCQPGDQGMYIYESDTDVTTFDFTETNNTVKKTATVSSSEALTAALTAGATEITLSDGTYTVDGAGGKDVTITGSKNAIIKLYNEGEQGCDYGFGDSGNSGGNYILNGVTIDTTENTGSYKGFAYHESMTFNNCTFVGAYSVNAAATQTFNNCTFDFNDGYFWTWAANEVNFNSCTFNGNSKAILAHGYASTEINIDDCNFAATEKGYASSGTVWTAAVEIDPAGTNTYTINITDSTINSNYAGWTRIKDDSTGHSINMTNCTEVVADGFSKNGDTYTISNVNGMQYFANEVNTNGNNFSGKTVKLVSNIDLKDIDWEPIGQTGATQFKGTFDGQNYTISNLSVDSSAETGGTYSSGLFGWAESGVTIKNVKVDGATVTGNHNVAVIVGYTYSGKISNCHVTNATITCNHANTDACGDKCGLIAGYAADESQITDCSASDSTVSAGRDAGQLIGCGYNASVSGCSATNVTVSATGECTGENVNGAIIGRVMG